MVPKTMGIGDRIFLERVCKKSEFIWTSQSLWTCR
jgi:hypothetical protein